MADDSRNFAVRVHPERDAELYAAITSRVDGESMTFKAFLQQALALAYPAEFTGVPSPAAGPTVSVPPAGAESGEGVLQWDTPPEGVPAAVAPQAPATVPAAPVAAPATWALIPGYGLDDRFDSCFRREYR